MQYIQSKVRWRFRKILWPSQKIWTLKANFFHFSKQIFKLQTFNILSEYKNQIHLTIVFWRFKIKTLNFYQRFNLFSWNEILKSTQNSKLVDFQNMDFCKSPCNLEKYANQIWIFWLWVLDQTTICTNAGVCIHTSLNSFYKWTKISSLEITIFCLKIMVKSGLDFLFRNHRAPSELLLPSAKISAQIGWIGLAA